jgi:hypothetical protein
MTDHPDPIHPASAETVRQLLKLHGARALITAIADISQAEGDAIAKANVKDATAPFAHRANATVLRSIVRRLYS